jgi:uncharacterized protein (DUF1501 family)
MSINRRREFLHRSLCAAAGSVAFGSMFAKMELAQAAATGGRTLEGNDYRAMVCIYLYGGNDCFNMVVPRDSAYATYQATRGSLAIPQNQLLAINPASGPVNGGQFGLHPVMTGARDMFEAGRMAIVANVGPLVRPTNKALYQQPGTLLPAQLFSHSDQSVLWQTPRADSNAHTGWGGRLADIFAATNPNQVLSMNVSLDGENVFQAGETVSPYFMNSDSVEQLWPIDTNGANCNGPETWNRRRCLTFQALQNLNHGHAFERAYVNKTQATIATSAQVSAAIALYPANDPVFQPFWTRHGLSWNANNPPELPRLAAQLLMIARVIRARGAGQLNMQRQLFFAGIGGFDNHDNQLDDHPPLLRDLSQSVQAFYDVLNSPSFNLGSSVTTFTASEFGRTLTNNGDGTDHGWGGHHLVWGNSVNGRRIFGRMPNLQANDNPDDTGWGGQIIPTLSADQYAATLASWYGLSAADRATIFPNLVHMTGSLMAIEGPNLGFML